MVEAKKNCLAEYIANYYNSINIDSFMYKIISCLELIYGKEKLNSAEIDNYLATYSSTEDVANFKTNVDLYKQWLDEKMVKKTDSLVEIELFLIKIIENRYLNDEIDVESMKFFDSVLFGTESTNFFIKLLNTLFNRKNKKVISTWKSKRYNLLHKISFKEIIPIKKTLPVKEEIKYLSIIQYENNGFSMEDIKKLSPDEVRRLNESILNAEAQEAAAAASSGGGRTNEKPYVKVLKGVI